MSLSSTQFFSSSPRALYQVVTWSNHAVSQGDPIMTMRARQSARDMIVKAQSLHPRYQAKGGKIFRKGLSAAVCGGGHVDKRVEDRRVEHGRIFVFDLQTKFLAQGDKEREKTYYYNPFSVQQLLDR